jgi:hypothetical protein
MFSAVTLKVKHANNPNKQKALLQDLSVNKLNMWEK